MDDVVVVSLGLWRTDSTWMINRARAAEWEKGLRYIRRWEDCWYAGSMINIVKRFGYESVIGMR